MAVALQADNGRFTMRNDANGVELPVIGFAVNETTGAITAVIVADGTDVSTGYTLKDYGAVKTKRNVA